MSTSPSSASFQAATFDTPTTIITVLTTVLLVATPGYLWLVGNNPTVVLGAAVLGLGSASLIAAMSPRSYRIVGETEVVIQRRLWPSFRTTVSGFSDHENPGRLGIRTRASGGVFGWWGRFHRADLGRYRAYLTTRDPSKIISLRTTDGIVVISPENPDEFKTSLKLTPIREDPQ